MEIYDEIPLVSGCVHALKPTLGPSDFSPGNLPEFPSLPWQPPKKTSCGRQGTEEMGEGRKGRGRERRVSRGFWSGAMTGWWWLEHDWIMTFHISYMDVIRNPLTNSIIFQDVFFNHQPDDFVETLGHHGDVTNFPGVQAQPNSDNNQCHFDRSGTGISTSVSMFPQYWAVLPQIIDTPHFLWLSHCESWLWLPSGELT